MSSAETSAIVIVALIWAGFAAPWVIEHVSRWAERESCGGKEEPIAER